MPGNPTIDNLDQVVQNFSNIVTDAINTSTSTRVIKTTHLRLPINIRELIKTKNRFRKLWNNTRYPPYKREVNALVRQIRQIEINEQKNRTWKNFLSTLNVEDNSLYQLHKRITKKHTVIPPLHGPSDHPTVSTCLFADDSAALTQGVHLNYTIKAMQKYLDTLEKWLTDWRIAINVEKSQAIVFRKWGVIDPQTELTLFENNIQWVPVVRYLGLHIDSRLTYKKHIDYLSDKFWGRIALAISLIGRSPPLSP
ncbi:putative RNA-directed DNA polymerase from transposon X-element [Trichonephila clavipes]|nr:putative RNA-directed DNA polymerase from transposon X-element [Trichonephila clavipes]